MNPRAPGTSQVLVLSVVYALFTVSVLLVHARGSVNDTRAFVQGTLSAVDRAVKEFFVSEDVDNVRAAMATAVRAAADSGDDRAPLAQVKEYVKTLLRGAAARDDLASYRDSIMSIIDTTVMETSAGMQKQVDKTELLAEALVVVDAAIADVRAETL